MWLMNGALFKVLLECWLCKTYLWFVHVWINKAVFTVIFQNAICTEKIFSIYYHFQMNISFCDKTIFVYKRVPYSSYWKSCCISFFFYFYSRCFEMVPSLSNTPLILEWGKGWKAPPRLVYSWVLHTSRAEASTRSWQMDATMQCMLCPHYLVT